MPASDAKLHEVGIGTNEGLLVATTLELAGDFLDRTGAVVGDVVQNEAVNCHVVIPPWVAACRKAGVPRGSMPRITPSVALHSAGGMFLSADERTPHRQRSCRLKEHAQVHARNRSRLVPISQRNCAKRPLVPQNGAGACRNAARATCFEGHLEYLRKKSPDRYINIRIEIMRNRQFHVA